MTTRIVELPGEKVKVDPREIGPGRVVSAILRIEEAGDSSLPATNPSDLTDAEWEKVFNEMLALAPVNEHPADVSREAMYMSDEEMRERGQ